MTNLQTYIDETDELPREILLGNLVIFTIRDGQHNLKQIAKDIDRLQLAGHTIGEDHDAVGD